MMDAAPNDLGLLTVEAEQTPSEENAPGVQLKEEDRARLGAYLSDLISQGLAERSGLEQRWERNWNDFHAANIPFVSKWFDQASDIGLPFSKPRADALQDSVVGMVFGAEPVVSARAPSENSDLGAIPDALEDVLGDAFDQNDLEEFCKGLTPQAWNTNHGITRIRWDDEKALPVPERIMPLDFVVTGATTSDLRSAALVGHSFRLLRRDFEASIRSKKYYDADFKMPRAKDAENQGDTVQAISGTPASRVDDIVELYEVVFRLDMGWFKKDDPEAKPGEDTYYVATVHLDGRHLCRIQEYPYPYPLYCTLGYKVQTERGYWCKQSVAADMQGPHMLYGCIFNIALYAALYGAFPSGTAQSIEGATKVEGAAAKSRQLRPNAIIEGVDGGVPFANRVNLGDLMALLNEAKALGDSACRVNQAGIGQEYSKQMTATEASQLAAGQAAGIGGYAATFSFGLLDMARCMLMLIKTHAGAYLEKHGLRLGVDPEALMRADEVTLEITGRNPSVAPQTVIANLGQMLSLEPPNPMEPPAINRHKVIERMMGQMQIPDPKELLNEQPPLGAIPGVPGMGGAPLDPAITGGGPQGNPLEEALGLAFGDPGIGQVTGPNIGL